MSSKFTDLKGREHSVEITLATAITLKKDLGVDIGNVNAIDKISGDWETLVNVLCVACRASFETHGLKTPEDVAECLGGDVLDAAATALWDAMADFFPPLKRQAFRGMLDKSKEVEALARKQIEQELKDVTPEAILAMSSNLAGSKAES